MPRAPHAPGPAPTCPGCGLAGELDGPRHPYIGASPWCWARYGELLARPGEKQDWVDAYAVQHPGTRGRREAQSVVSHLISICCALERDATPAWRVRLLRRATARSDSFEWLAPPSDPGRVTVVDVLEGRADGEDWTRSVWHAWEEHHAAIRVLADGIAAG